MFPDINTDGSCTMPPNKDKDFNIILVFGFFRAHNYYLNIVKYLSRKYSIGVYIAPADKRFGDYARKIVKLKQTEQQFISCLESYGADIIEEGTYSCNLLVFPQVPFNLDFVKEVDAKITRNNAIVIIPAVSYGMEMLKDISEIGISKLLVFDESIFFTKLDNDKDRAFVQGNFEIVETGSPYKKYPVFEGLDIDYLIAFPTAMLIRDPSIRNRLWENMLSLINKIDKDDKIVLKQHNVKDNDRRSLNSNKKSLWDEVFPMIALKLFRAILNIFGAFLVKNRVVADKVWRVSNYILERNAQFLSSVTPYCNFGAELFLPSVKKGLISGISGVLWYALSDRLPVYNCDDQPFDEGLLPNGEVYKHFYVAPCGGRLEFDPENFKKVPAPPAGADLIRLIQSEL